MTASLLDLSHFLIGPKVAWQSRRMLLSRVRLTDYIRSTLIHCFNFAFSRFSRFHVCVDTLTLMMMVVINDSVRLLRSILDR